MLFWDFTMHLCKRKTRTILFPHSYVSRNIPILYASTHASAYAYFHFYKRHWALNEYAYPLSSSFEFPGSVLKVCQKHERKYVKCRYIEGSLFQKTLMFPLSDPEILNWMKEKLWLSNNWRVIHLIDRLIL